MNPADFKVKAKQLLTLLKKDILAIVLAGIAIYICFMNYSLGTFLTGWDTLHPEFNYRIYWSRILDGVWQEHQGVGAVATQAHAAEIPRILILMLFDIFLALNQIRYAYAFLMLVLGPLGMYFFLKLVILKRFSLPAKNLGAFAGALFYVLNLSTLQHFYVPLEMFLTHFGMLGWLFLFACLYFESRNWKHLTAFAVVCFFSCPQAHTATLFYAYMVCFTAFLGLLLIQKLVLRQYQFIRPFSVIILITLAINSYWLMPNLYFAFRHGKQVQESKIHFLFSQEAFLQNKSFGKMKNAAILKNFLFNWQEHIGFGEFGYLLNEWRIHQHNPLVLPIGYTFFGLSIFGILVSLARREKYSLAAFSGFFISLFFILNLNPPFGFIFGFLQKHVPLFEEAFRFPFTKFSTHLAFFYGVFISYSISQFVLLGNKILSYPRLKNALQVFIFLLVSTSLIYYMLPAFFGYLISPSMKVAIPERYFELFDYFDEQEEYGRVAHLPIHSFWGWIYYDWQEQTRLGYQGAGFLWFGIKQPLLDREFDRWSPGNEQYYRDASQAIYSQDIPMLESVFDKYQVRWILLDKSVWAPGYESSVLFFDGLNKMFLKSKRIDFEEDFGDGLLLYKFYPEVDFEKSYTADFMYGEPRFLKEFSDPVYAQYGCYVSSKERHYPFVGITNYDDSLIPKYIQSDSSSLTLLSHISPFDTKDFSVGARGLRLSVYLKSSGRGHTIVVRNESDVAADLYQEFSINAVGHDSFLVSLGKGIFLAQKSLLSDGKTEERLGEVYITDEEELNLYIYSLDLNKIEPTVVLPTLEACSLPGKKASYTLDWTDNGFDLLAKNVKACVTAPLKDFVPKISDEIKPLLRIKSDFVNLGAKPSFCVLDDRTGLCQTDLFYGEFGRAAGTMDGYKFLGPDDLDHYFVRFFADGANKKSEVGVAYDNVDVYLLDLINTYKIDLEVMKSEFDRIDLPNLVFKKSPFFAGNITTFENYPRLCSSGAELEGESDVSVIDGKYIRYIAKDVAVCDSIAFPSISHNTGAILEFRSRNITGMPLRLCLTNESSKRCDVYLSLTENDEFTTQYFWVPPMGDGEGYTMNFSNLVFGGDETINDLEYIGITPVPYHWVRSLHKELDKPRENEHLLVSSEHFEEGWVAFCGILPCRARHISVNNWANGWVFDGEIPENVEVVFLPQLLEYFGFLVLIGVYMFLDAEKKNSDVQ